jgi:menaquinone-dependent protoporphyrinogen oxidase
MRVLVAYGSKAGGTRGIAETIGDELRRHALDVDVVSVGDVRDPSAYDALVVGGALYMGRWHRGATHFLRKHATIVRQRPTWAFSSGPLDDSATRTNIPPTAQLQKLLDKVSARGHATFGGPEHAGDRRDAAQIRGWASSIAAALVQQPSAFGAIAAH